MCCLDYNSFQERADSKAISPIQWKFSFGDFYYLQDISTVNLN